MIKHTLLLVTICSAYLGAALADDLSVTTQTTHHPKTVKPKQFSDPLFKPKPAVDPKQFDDPVFKPKPKVNPEQFSDPLFKPKPGEPAGNPAR